MSHLNFCPNCGHDISQFKDTADSSKDTVDLKVAVQAVIDSGKASTSLLQRKLRIGYGKASRIIDTMEEMGYIGPAQDNSKPREVLIKSVDDM